MLLKIALSFFALSSLSFSYCREYKKAEAVDEWSETYTMRQLGYPYASAFYNDHSIEYVDSANGKYSYGFGVGSVLDGFTNFEKLDSYTLNNSYSFYSGENASTVANFVHWVFYTTNNEGIIAYFRVNEKMSFKSNGVSLGGNPVGAYINFYIKRSGGSITQLKSTE